MVNPMDYLWAVAAVVWIGTMVYVAGLMRRQTRVSKQLEQLERQIERQRPQS